jgi:membrane associated rhomboid family serine protease
VTHFLLLILVFIGVALYFMTSVERNRLLGVILAALRKVKETVTLEGLQCDPFFDALRARTPRVVATPLLIALSAAITIFVHSPLLDLFVSAVCLWQIGLILERLVGRLAFTTVYVASGVAAGIVSLSESTGGMSVGASESVLGMYGLLLVISISSMIQGSSLTIPLNVTKRLAPVAAIFVLYKLTTTDLGNVAELAALVCGLVGGIVVARDVIERTPRVRRLATAMATVVTVGTLYALTVLHRPLNEPVDVRPEINRVIAVEGRTAGLYDKEVDRFRRGRITASALADVIEKTIVPELHVVAGRLRALQDVPPEHQPLIATAETFLKLRHESWRLRAVALHKSDTLGLRQADSKEQASRDAFHRLKMPLPPDSSRQPSS